jgi:cytochrome bd ubiquinol oxidase subunit II
MPLFCPATTDPAYNLTIYNTAASPHGLTWWVPGMILALGYFVFIFRMFRGKVQREGEGY